MAKHRSGASSPAAHTLRGGLSWITWRTSRRAFAFIGTIVFALGVQFTYVYHLVPITGQGYSDFGPSLVAVVLSIIAAVFPILWLPMFTERVSALVLWTVYLCIYVPACVIPVHSNPDPLGGYRTYVVCLAVCMVVATAFCRVRRAPAALAAFARSSPWAVTIVTGFAVAATGLVVASYGFNLEQALDLDTLYDLREDSIALEVNIFSAYAVSVLGYSILPFLIAWGLIRKNRVLLVVAVACELVMYGATAQKSFGYLSFVVIGLYFLMRFRVSSLIRFMPAALALLVWLVNAYASASGEYLLSILLVQRVFIVPGLLSAAYYDFFSANPFVYLSHGPLRWLLDYPYESNPAIMVGRAYFDREGSWANANFWAESFAQAGYAGMFIATVLLGFVFVILDFLAKRHGPALIYLAMLGPLSSLINTGFLTTMSTGGLGLLLLVLLTVPTADISTRTQRQKHRARPSSGADLHGIPQRRHAH